MAEDRPNRLGFGAVAGLMVGALVIGIVLGVAICHQQDPLEGKIEVPAPR